MAKNSEVVWAMGSVELQTDGWYAIRGSDGCVDTLCKTFDGARLHLVRAAFDALILDLSVDSEWNAKALTALREASDKLTDKTLAQKCAALVEMREE